MDYLLCHLRLYPLIIIVLLIHKTLRVNIYLYKDTDNSVISEKFPLRPLDFQNKITILTNFYTFQFQIQNESHSN